MLLHLSPRTLLHPLQHLNLQLRAWRSMQRISHHPLTIKFKEIRSLAQTQSAVQLQVNCNMVPPARGFHADSTGLKQAVQQALLYVYLLLIQHSPCHELQRTVVTFS